jgi:hypothetical protein
MSPLLPVPDSVETFTHRGVSYNVVWRPSDRPNVMYRMSQCGLAMSVRESKLAMRAFQRRNADKLDAIRNRRKT